MENLFNRKKLEQLHQLLTMRKETLAVAESVTTGMVQLAVGSAESASEFYQGGITTYNAGQKYKHLNVEPVHALGCNCVSQKVADEMGFHCAQLFCSDWGIGITGYATPVPESANKLFAFISIAYKNVIVFHKKINAAQDDPFSVQQYYTASVLNYLIKQL